MKLFLNPGQAAGIISDTAESGLRAVTRGNLRKTVGRLGVVGVGLDFGLSVGFANSGHKVSSGVASLSANAVGLGSGIAGSVAGGIIGGTIGSVIGPEGTVAGAWLGRLAGGIVGNAAGDYATRSTVLKTMGFLMEAGRRAGRPNFGGHYTDTEVAYTLRQRSAMEMGRSLLNAQSWLGKESVLYHQ